MSGRCDLQIVFSRADRTWKGGETVSGQVTIRVQQETQSNGIRLIHSWRTHGRGNRDVGPPQTMVLSDAVPLSPGQELRFPFSFTAPTHPVTYRGHLVNVDHYVRAEVDVSWARNPFAEEDFLLRPGETPPQLVGARDKVVSLKEEPASSAGMIGKAVLFILAGIVLVLLAVFALVLLPVVLLVVAFFWVKNQALKSRLGEVELKLPHKIVAPGEPWPLTLGFTARKSFSVTSISLTFRAVESAASGSGTDKKTHTHTLLEEPHQIRESGLIEAGETVDEQRTVPFPETDAFSFEASDNSVKWTAEVRIDMPGFPDWVHTEVLQVVPKEFLSAGDLSTTDGQRTLPSKSSPLPEFTGSGFDGEADSESTESDDLRDEDLPTSLRAPVAAGSIMQLVEMLNSVGRHSTQRAEIVRAASHSAMDISVCIDRVVSTAGLMLDDTRYESGKTVTGTLEGTRQAIQVMALPDSSKTLEMLRPGDAWQVTVRVREWDTLYNRINAVETGTLHG